jgi:hypothetical protein
VVRLIQTCLRRTRWEIYWAVHINRNFPYDLRLATIAGYSVSLTNIVSSLTVPSSLSCRSKTGFTTPGGDGPRSRLMTLACRDYSGDYSANHRPTVLLRASPAHPRQQEFPNRVFVWARRVFKFST